MRPHIAAFAAGLSLGAASALPASAAPSTDPQVVADVHCLLLSSVASASQDADIRQTSIFAMAYYLGRLDQRQPTVDVEATMQAEAPKVQASIHQDAERCGAAIEKRGGEFNAMGERLRATLRATPSMPAPAAQTPAPAAPQAQAVPPAGQPAPAPDPH